MRSAALLLVLALSGLVACKRRDEDRRAPPPEPPARAVDCERPGAVADAIAAPFFAARVGSLCLDPGAPAKAYGAEAPRSLDEVCTELFDGECEMYKSLGLERVVTVHYGDAKVKGATVNVSLSRFATPEAAFAFYTRRVAGDVDPAVLKLVPITPLSVRGAGVAYVARGKHVAELAYLDDAATAATLEAAGKDVLAPLASAVADRLPGEAAPPRSAAMLPEPNGIPLGVLFTTKDLLGVKELGGGAVGAYRDGPRRWRVGVAIHPDDASAAKAMDAVRAAWAGSGSMQPIAGFASEAFAVERREDAAAPVLAYVFARAGSKVAFAMDDDHARRAKQTPDEARAVTIDEDRKLAELARALGVPERKGKKP